MQINYRKYTQHQCVFGFQIFHIIGPQQSPVELWLPIFFYLQSLTINISREEVSFIPVALQKLKLLRSTSFFKDVYEIKS